MFTPAPLPPLPAFPGDQGSPRPHVGVEAESCLDLMRCLPWGRELRPAGASWDEGVKTARHAHWLAWPGPTAKPRTSCHPGW